MAKIKILLVDDHAVVRDGLATMLGRQNDFAVVGEAANGLEAVELAAKVSPDVILMDLRMPELDGVEAMRRIRSTNEEVNFIVLTTYDSDEYIFDAIEAGAKGYLLKDASRDELFHAVRMVNGGESLIEPGVAVRLLDRFAQLSRTVGQGNPTGPLSDREVDVLLLMAKGEGNKQIGVSLSISESTVKTHVTRIFQKLEVKGPGRGGSPRDAEGPDKALINRQYHGSIGRKTDFRVGLLVLAKLEIWGITATPSMVSIMALSNLKPRQEDMMVTPSFGPNMLLELHKSWERDLFAEGKRSRVQASRYEAADLNHTKSSRDSKRGGSCDGPWRNSGFLDPPGLESQ